jgi:GNAT superfamily N-acetyltransferase
MKTIYLRPARPEQDFGQLTTWFSSIEDEPTSVPAFKDYFEKNTQRIIQVVAEDELGRLLGFYWAIRDRSIPGRYECYLFVIPEQRRLGIGSRLADDLLQAVADLGADDLRVTISADCRECLDFAERRGYTERCRQIALELDLQAFDDRPYDGLIARLGGEGVSFTTMEALGNTEEAQRKLYFLNDATAMDVPGSSGEHIWDSFADFQESVCQADWYKPDGQFVAINTVTGEWAAMCAITRFAGNDHANTLHIGVDRRYRGLKLGQAVRVLALRYARDVLKIGTVRTYHTAQNLPALTIDRKLGYMQIRETVLMQKALK